MCEEIMAILRYKDDSELLTVSTFDVKKKKKKKKKEKIRWRTATSVEAVRLFALGSRRQTVAAYTHCRLSGEQSANPTSPSVL